MEFLLVFIIVSFYDHFSRKKNQGNDELKTTKRPSQCRSTSQERLGQKRKWLQIMVSTLLLFIQLMLSLSRAERAITWWTPPLRNSIFGLYSKNQNFDFSWEKNLKWDLNLKSSHPCFAALFFWGSIISKTYHRGYKIQPYFHITLAHL